MTKIDLTPIEDAIRHLREENERQAKQIAAQSYTIGINIKERARLNEELSKLREANATQAETIRRYQQDARKWLGTGLHEQGRKTLEFWGEEA